MTFSHVYIVASVVGSIASEIRSIYAANPLPQTAAKLNIGLSLSGTLVGTSTLLVQLYDIPIDVSSVGPDWLSGAKRPHNVR